MFRSALSVVCIFALLWLWWTRFDPETQLVVTGIAALTFLLLAGASALGTKTRIWTATLGKSAFGAGLLHLGGFGASRLAEVADPQGLLSEIPVFVAPGLLAVAALCALNMARSSRSSAWRGALADAALLLSALHVIAIQEPQPLVVVGATLAFLVVAMRALRGRGNPTAVAVDALRATR